MFVSLTKTANDTYDIGDTVVYQPFGGGERHVKVTAKEADIKNGRPGFDGTIIGDGQSVWGYDDQILFVIRHR